MTRAYWILLISLAAAIASADSRKYLPQEVGRYQGWGFTASPANIRDYRATAAELKAVEASALRLQKLILSAPVLNPPKGFEVFLKGILMQPDPSQVRVRTAAGLPLDVWLRFGAPEYHEFQGKRLVETQGNHLDFFINDLRPVILDHIGTRKWEDAQGDFYLEPQATARVGGFPLYKDVMAITRPGESIWAPIPVERFLKKHVLALKSAAGDAEKTRDRAKKNLEVFRSAPEKEKRQKEIEAARKSSNAAMEVRRLEFFFKQDEDEILKKANTDPAKDDWYYGPVGALKDAETRLASLDTAGRQAAVCLSGFESPLPWKLRIVPPGTPGCRTVVQPNLSVFHAKLPRGAIQVILLEGLDYCREVIRAAGNDWKNPADCTVNLVMEKQLDWKAIGALIEP